MIFFILFLLYQNFTTPKNLTRLCSILFSILNLYQYQDCQDKMQQDLQLLPPRKKPTGKVQTAGKITKLHTNLYEVSLKKTPNLQQYTIETQPAIDDQGISLLRKVLMTKREQLVNSIGLLTFKGRMLWGTKIFNKVLSFIVDKNLDKKIQQSYQIFIKHTRSIAYADITLIKGQQFRQIQQIYTVALRQKLYQMGLKQTTRNRFLQKGKGQIVSGYTILLCYQLKLVPIYKHLNLLVDVGFRLLNQRNALEELQQIKNKDSKADYCIGKIVVTGYNNRSYRVEKLCFDKNPKSTFYHQKRGKDMTFLQYFKEFHNIVPTKLDQPLFQCLISVKYEIKNGKKIKIQTRGYLLPEFCKFAAKMSSLRETDYHSFADVSRKIKITPQERKQKQLNLVGEINNHSGIFVVNDNCTEAEGFVYQDIRVLGNKIAYQSTNGLLRDLKQIKEPQLFRQDDWLLVYANIKNIRQQKQAAFEAYKNLAASAKYYQIQFKKPYLLQVRDPGAQSWIQQIQIYRQNNQKYWRSIKIVFLLFGNYQKNYYSQIKKYITNKLFLPCQVVLKKTADHKNKTSIFGKIALQMNAKIGNVLWSVPPKHSFWAKKRIAYGAFSKSRNLPQQTRRMNKQQAQQAQFQNQNQYALGFVGTCSSDLSKIYAAAKMIEDLKQLQSVAPFENIIADWFKNFKSFQQYMPQIIIIYRQGLTEKQIQTQARAQVDAIHKVVTRARVRYPDYSPQIIYILVTKRSPKRIYRAERMQGSSGKFAPNVMGNPIPGTIVFESISTENVYDFHLTAQTTTQGTTTLTNFHIAYDASQIPQEAIAQFTMEQCYNYPNWQGGIRVPSCLQSADKLSRLVGEHIHQDIEDKEVEGKKVWDIRNKPFYL